MPGQIGAEQCDEAGRRMDHDRDCQSENRSRHPDSLGIFHKAPITKQRQQAENQGQIIVNQRDPVDSSKVCDIDEKQQSCEEAQFQIDFLPEKRECDKPRGQGVQDDVQQVIGGRVLSPDQIAGEHDEIKRWARVVIALRRCDEGKVVGQLFDVGQDKPIIGAIPKILGEQIAECKQCYQNHQERKNGPRSSAVREVKYHL